MEERQKRPKLVLVDGSNYVFRAFYAIRDLSNSKGFPTNAIYGFTTMLIKLLREEEPDYIAVVFDLKAPTFRHEAYDQYKATRRATPEALIPQIPYIKEIVRGFAIPVLEQEGLEADDIIGTIARRQAADGFKVVIASGDKDLMQLVGDDVVMVDTMRDKVYDAAAVRERFGVGPEKVVDILGLTGDESDNIPGVPGIGPKGAQRLIEQFGSLEEVLAHPEKIPNAKIRQAIIANADKARLSRELASIRTDADFAFDIDQCRRREPDNERLLELFREFEFSSLLQDLRVRETEAALQYRLCRTKEELAACLRRVRQEGALGIELLLSTDEPMRASLVGIALSPKAGEAYYVPLTHEGLERQLASADVLEELRPLLADAALKKHGSDLKTSLIVLAEAGVLLEGLGCDTTVASYILNPSRRSFDLAEVAQEYLRHRIPSAREVVGSGAKAVPFATLPADRAGDYVCRRVDAVMALRPELERRMEEAGLFDLFRDVEMPLVAVLAAMERKGVLIDAALLKGMSREMEHLLSLAEEKIHRLAGEKFNINSPKQLQVILFDKLKLPRGRKTKEGYSTDVDVLSHLALSHELPAEILAFRAMVKLKSTYIDALPELINPRTGRIHTSYNQTVAATGRLSSSNPNLQNIPIRTPEGKRIRQAFTAPPGCEIVSADYSQIELRVLAHLSGDERLREAFAAGEDIHRRTAADIFGVFPEMVTPDMRRQAKVINFGVLYGMSAFGLARELGISQKLAQEYIDGYFRKYSKVREYLDGLLERAREEGYVTTLLKRRRYLPELKSPQPVVRQFAERMAINTPIQGTAADLIKVAMVRIFERLRREGMRSAMIMQVHDELVFEAPAEERETLTRMVKEEMEGVLKLDVPLEVEIGAGRSWDEAHA